MNEIELNFVSLFQQSRGGTIYRKIITDSSSFKEKERIELREPRRFKVTIYNDDFTTMEFVVKVLTTVFYKSSVEAETLMLQVHKSNSAVVGIYSYDIAHSKVQKAKG